MNDLALANRQRLVHVLGCVVAGANLLDLNILTVSQEVILRDGIVLLLIATTPVGDRGISIRF